MALEGLSMILMVRAIYGSYSLAGLISAANVIAYALCVPVLSRLVDRYGQAKIMIPSITISSLSIVAIIVGALNHLDPIVITILAIIMGATSGSMGAMVRARWAHVVKSGDQLQAAYALEAAFDELVFVLGPVVATLVTTAIHPTAGLWVSLFFLFFGTLGFLVQKKTEPPKTPHVRGEKLPSVMANPAMIVLAVTYVGTGALFGALDLTVVANAEAFNMSFAAGMILATMSLGSLLSALAYGARMWRKPLWQLFSIGVVLLAVGVSTFVFAPNLIWLSGLMFIAGITIAPTMTNVNTIVQRIVPSSRLTEGLSWMSTAMTLGVSLGSALGGPVIDSHGYPAGFVLVMGFGWFMALAAVVGYRPLRNQIRGATSPVDLARAGLPVPDHSS